MSLLSIWHNKLACHSDLIADSIHDLACCRALPTTGVMARNRALAMSEARLMKQLSGSMSARRGQQNAPSTDHVEPTQLPKPPSFIDQVKVDIKDTAVMPVSPFGEASATALSPARPGGARGRTGGADCLIDDSNTAPEPHGGGAGDV